MGGDFGFIFVFSVLGVIFGAISAFSRSRHSALLVNLSITTIILLFFELYFWKTDQVQTLLRQPTEELPDQAVLPAGRKSKHIRPSPLLGYAARPGRHHAADRVTEQKQTEPIYYTIKESGVRGGFEHGNSKAKKVNLFFGGSFTFGHGVEDDQTYPAQFEARSGIRSLNFGLDGYGPHQMLATLENGLESRAIGSDQPVAAYYLAIEDHLNRIAGHTWYSVLGPHYTLNPNGQATTSGPFLNPTLAAPLFWFRNSYFFQYLIDGFLSRDRGESNREGQISLFGAIVHQSQNILARRHQVDLTVITWSKPNALREKMIEALNKKQIRNIAIERLVPNIHNDSKIFEIPLDNHPNQAAYQILAESLLKN